MDEKEKNLADRFYEAVNKIPEESRYFRDMTLFMEGVAFAMRHLERSETSPEPLPAER